MTATPEDRDSTPPLRSRVIWGLLLGTILVVMVRTFLPDMVWLGARRVTVTDIKPDSGARLIGTLGDQTLSNSTLATARFDLVERRPGGFLHALDVRFGNSWAFAWLRSLYDANYPAETHEVVTTLLLGGATDADIANLGEGRFSIRDGRVLFSLFDGKTASDIVRLDVWVPRIDSVAKYKVWPWVVRWGTGGVVALLLIALLWFTPPLLAYNLWPGITITLVMMAMLCAGAEYYARLTGKFPKTMIEWPATFSPEAGVVFAPHSVVRFTDGFEFWTQDATNSLGFLDHEPVIPKPDGTFRILLVGDSILEAAQVPLANKVQTLLAAEFRKIGQKVDVVAISRSGVGQASELGFYNANRQVKPDLVVLLFVGNDFANNSILLESLRSGFSPDHLPWWFPAFDEDKRCKLVPPNPDWNKHILLNPVDRMARLRARSAEDARLLDTLMPDFVDSVFYAREGKITEIYEQAVQLTKCSFGMWKDAAERDGFKLLILVTDNVTVPGKSGQIDRINRISSELQIPLFDLYPAWAKHGVAGGKFKFDGHWNADGHRWSADALFDYLVSQQLVGRSAERK